MTLIQDNLMHQYVSFESAIINDGMIIMDKQESKMAASDLEK